MQLGAEGNALLTSMTAVALLVLLALEGVTNLRIRPLISAHRFVGLPLVPPVALKLASTGRRFVSYYAARPEYVAKVPRRIVQRAVVAPLVEVSTIVLSAAVAVGVVFAAGSFHLASPWLDWVGNRR